MRLVAASLVYVAVSSLVALLLGMTVGGLNETVCVVSLMSGAIAAVAAFVSTPPSPRPQSTDGSQTPYRHAWVWAVGFVFALFAVRSFCWLLYFDDEAMRIQSPHNLGDLGLHVTYIKYFANGIRLWPDSPLYVFSLLRYPAGIDLFNGLLTNLGFDLRHQLTATGLLASAVTFWAFYRWGGPFGIAGFLFNGGIAGYQFFRTFQFLAYQDGPHISWKSIPLTMFVTQRGLLYAIPAGLALLWHWRTKYRASNEAAGMTLPTWVEYVLYATMPLFHTHTFIVLNFVLIAIFVGRPQSRASLLKLVGAAFLPATFFVWLTTDHFRAGSFFEWQFGWTQNVGEFAMPFFLFWFVNFGLFLLLVIPLAGIVAREEWRKLKAGDREISTDALYLTAACLIFLFACTAKTAPWEWDNMKLIIWAYFLTLPVLWNRLIRSWPLPVRIGACFILFFSGFVDLFGGLAAGRPGFEFANRAETDILASVTRTLAVEARFAGFPTYNHPLLLNGRKMVCGYTGHVWTQGIEYAPVEAKLTSLMSGQSNWLELGHELRVRYLFWGNLEKTNYPTSSRPWENKLSIVAQGSWGAIYDFGPVRQ
jgi:hypothetical protein